MFDGSILTGPVANYAIADSDSRALERDYSTGDIRHIMVSSVVWCFNTAAFTVATRSRWIGIAESCPWAFVSQCGSRRHPRRADTFGAVQLRAEVFNLLNTPAFGTPVGVLGAANFGSITKPKILEWFNSR